MPPPERPETYLRIGDGVYPAFALLAAMQLDLFTPLKDGPLSAESLAQALGVDVVKLRPVLYILVHSGLLTLNEDRFGSTAESDYYLVRGRPAYMGGAHELVSDLWSAMLKSATSIRTGHAAAKHDFSTMTRDELAAFLRGLHAGALATGRALTRRYDFTAYRSLLDVGGGSGGVSLALVEANPQLRATIADLPTVIPLTEMFIAEAGLADRVKTQVADVVNERPAGEYDVAIMKAFIQVLGTEEARRALVHVGQAVQPGGALYISGQILDDSRLSPQTAVYMNLVFANVYDGGQAYTEGEYRAWLAEAGFENVERVIREDGTSIITARKGTSS
jgi:hypothetical protein